LIGPDWTNTTNCQAQAHPCPSPLHAGGGSGYGQGKLVAQISDERAAFLSSGKTTTASSGAGF